jgi:hypothetical protein
MCPDDQILSVYHDQELPSPWKEKMDAHLRSCPDCRARFEQLRGLSAALREEPSFKAGFSPEAAGERVWAALAGLVQTQTTASKDPGKEFPRRSLRRVWGRSVSIPLPAAVAAAALLALSFTLALVNFSAGTGEPPDMAITAGMDLDAHSIVPVSNMNDVLQYLERDNSGGDIMIIRLPDTQHFMSTGEPAIIKAADYSRRAGAP